MENHYSYNLFDRRARPITKSKAPAVRWFREWVPQDVIATGGKCMVLKWVNEATLKATKDKSGDAQHVDPEPEPTTEVLFLCSFEGCGKTFIDAGALRKHSHIHGEKQYVCHYENCGKKFLDSSKLKRHFLIHTGERDFVCPHEGCGKAFSLDFNLRSHMKTHSQENYHVCPYPDCGKRYAHEYKLKNHITTNHEKGPMDTNITVKYTPPPEKPAKTTKSSSAALGPATPQRPYACPYEGCDKAYIHEYKLNLHLKREHPNHFSDERAYRNTQINENEMAATDEVSDHEALKRGKSQKKNRPKPSLKMPPSKAAKHKNNSNGNAAAFTSTVNLNAAKKPWASSRKEEAYEDDEDSEETEEDRENVVGEGWRYGEINSSRNNNEEEEEDDEETEYED